MAPFATQHEDDSNAASILLQHVPEHERGNLFTSLLERLRPDDGAGLELTASLVMQHSNLGVQRRLLSFMDQVIRSGQSQCVVLASLSHPDLCLRLSTIAVDILCEAKSLGGGTADVTVLNYLRFLQSTISHLPFGTVHPNLFRACLALLGAANQEICFAANTIISNILSSKNQESVKGILLPSRPDVWESIQNLIASASKLHVLLGYSLWLRWILGLGKELQTDFNTDKYWQLILRGLRHGDTERRKVCLHVLKSSIATEAAAVSQEVRELNIRYCTVFETIVLGRYMNQIYECEKDLQLLAMDDRLQPQWLYTLLASALDCHMQESTRKFIGNWVMQSGLRPNPELLGFFRHDFMPWATQGQLFVATLRKQGDKLRCEHGDRLASFIGSLLQHSQEPERLVDTIMEMMRTKRNSMFAYAIVYLLEGLGEILPSERIENFIDVNRLPEVARDFVSSKTWKADIPEWKQQQASRREVLEQEAIEKCRSFDGELQALQDIWSDLDYLEYPKRLLILVPGVLMEPRLVQRASKEPSLATDIAEKLRTLQGVAETKTFLFSPLVSSLRTALTSTPNADALQSLGIVEFVASVADHPPKPTVDLMLEEATIHLTHFTYEHYFGERPSYGFAAYLDLVSRLRARQDLVRETLDRMLHPWKSQKLPVLTVSPWKTTLQLQVLLLCFEQYIPETRAHIHNLLEDLFYVLAVEPLPRYRYLLEWIIVRLLMKYDLHDTLLARLATKDHHSNAKHLASLMKIGTIIACHTKSNEDFATRMTTIFGPLAASSKVVIRHEAQWQVPLLMDYARLKSWASITSNPAFTSLDDYIRSLERFHEPPLERHIGRFDPSKDHTFANLVEGRWFDLDHTEAPLTSHSEFVKLYNAELHSKAPASCISLGEIEEPAPAFQANKPEPPNGKPVGPKTSDEVAALQTKGTAYLARTLTGVDNDKSRPNNVIVVGSLVDNPYNLGGLSRVSEIFGASALCLQNQNVLSNKDFTSVSVSSHLHFPIVQLSASGIPTFLAERKAEGFTVVGIEQTDRSVLLGSEGTELPGKVALVVGSEKEGIPAVVLMECDVLVEIPQQGVTRSLNVQTAVSIVLYEHARQHGNVA